ERLDAAAIIAILLLNGVLGFAQELRAGQALAALRKLVAPRARVRRHGSSLLIAASEVVPGAVLMLEGGDVVAADARLISGERLETNEAALTGESTPVRKDAAAVQPPQQALAERAGMVFAGTHV